MIKYSIIIPVYKVENYLKQCVDSVLSQNYKNFEIILVDDGSPDSCPAICDVYSKSYNNIITIHKKNGGASEARNTGIEIASGDYITFLDSDDYWNLTTVLSDVSDIIRRDQFPDMILTEKIKKFNNGLISTPTDINFKQLSKLKDKKKIFEYLFYQEGDLRISPYLKFVKSDLVKKTYFTRDLIAEDVDWSLRLYPKAKSISFNPNFYYVYRVARPGSITSNGNEKSFKSLIKIIKDNYENIQNLNITQSEKDIYKGYLLYQLTIAMNLVSRVSKQYKKEAIKNIKELKFLLKEKTNFKTSKIKLIWKLFGTKFTCKAITLYLKHRS